MRLSLVRAQLEKPEFGGIAKWFTAPVLKADVGESLPWVRIPLPPPLIIGGTLHGQGEEGPTSLIGEGRWE